MKNIGLEFLAAGILESAGDDAITADTDTPDALDSFLETSRLAAALGPGGHQRAHNLSVEAQERDTALAGHYKSIAEKAAKTNPPAASPAPEADTLEKRESANRRKTNLREFLKVRLAEGDTAEAVIAHARKHDERTALLLSEIAQELGA